MTIDLQRVVLEQLSEGTISMDEAERRLAALATPDEPTDNPEPTDTDEPSPAPTRVLPTQGSRDIPRVSVRLSGPALINAVGVIDADEPALEGPHSAEVTELDDGWEVAGQLGDDGLLVLPRDVDLVFEANSASSSLRGIRGRLQGMFNVGECDIALCPMGESRIVANVGHLRLSLHPDSDVEVRLMCATSIEVADEIPKIGRGVWRMGAGTASLDIGGSPGEVTVEVSEA